MGRHGLLGWGLWVSGSRPRGPGSGFWVPGSRGRILGFGLWVLEPWNGFESPPHGFRSPFAKLPEPIFLEWNGCGSPLRSSRSQDELSRSRKIDFGSLGSEALLRSFRSRFFSSGMGAGALCEAAEIDFSRAGKLILPSQAH